MRKILWVMGILLMATPAWAQSPIDVTAIHMWNSTGGSDRCTVAVVNGTPSGLNTCDFRIDYATGGIWHKVSGTWVKVADLPVNLSGAQVTGVLPAGGSNGQGGTGRNGLTQYAVLVGEGNSGVNGVAAVAVNQVLVSEGVSADPAYSGTPTVTSLTTTGSIIPATVGSSLIPVTSDTYDLGSYSHLWNHGHIAQMDALVFSISTQTLFGGYSTIGLNAGQLPAVASGDTTIVFPITMTNLDFVVVRAQDTGGNYVSEFMQITGSACTTCTVTRNLSGAGAKNWAAGTPFLVRRNATSEIDLLAYDGYPRMVISQQGSTYNSQTEQVVLGDLDGYFGYASHVNGLAVGVPTGAWVKVDPTNGVQIGYNATTVTRVDASGNASFGTGSVTIDTNGIAITTAVTSLSTAHAYRFAGTGGIFSYFAEFEPTAGSPTGVFTVSTSDGSKRAFLSVTASSGSTGASIAFGAEQTGTPESEIYITATTVRLMGRAAGVAVMDSSGVLTSTTTPTMTQASIGTSSAVYPLQVVEAAAKSTGTTTNIASFGSNDTFGASDLALFIRRGGNATQSQRFTGIQSYESGYGSQSLVFQDNGGYVAIGPQIPKSILTVANNVATTYLDTFPQYQLLLYDSGTATSSYGLGVKSGVLLFNSGGNGYEFEDAGTSVAMSLSSGTLTLPAYVSCGHLSTDGSGIVVCSPSPTYADLESRILALEQQLAIRSPNPKEKNK